DEEELAEIIKDEGKGMGDIMAALPNDKRYFLFIDQFEEVFTVCSSEGERKRFLDLITEGDNKNNSSLVIVTTMRADFLDRCLRYQSLYEIIQRQGIYMPPLKEKEIENIIVKPAQRQGFKIETGLLAQLLKDVSEEKNFLPLLEFALTLLWEKRDQYNKILTLQAYQQLGTVGAQGLRPPNIVNPQPSNQDLGKISPLAPLNKGGNTEVPLFKGDLGGSNTEGKPPLSNQDLGESNRKTGLTQALNLYAEKVYQYKDYYRDNPTQERTALEKQWIKLIFLRLIRTANQEKDTRQRLPKGVLLNIVGDDASEQKAFSKLIDGKYGLVSARLLVTGGDRPISLPVEENINGFEAEGSRQEAGVNQFTPSNDDMKENISPPSPHTSLSSPTPLSSPSSHTPHTWVDLVHEALIEGWDTFTKWREEDRELRRLGERLEEQRQEWLKHQSENHFMMGGLLMQVRQQWEELRPFLLYPKEAEAFYHQSDDYEKAKIKELADLNVAIDNAQRELKNAQTAVKLEPEGLKALDLLSQHQPMQALLTALKAGKQLLPLRQADNHYPANSPILALNTLYDKLPKRVDLKGHQYSVNNAQFSPDGEKIVTASQDNTAKVWDSKGNLLTTLEGHQDFVYNAQFSPDGEKIVTASEDKTAKMWDSNGNLLTTLEGHQDWVRNAQFSPDEEKIVTVSGDKTAKVWDSNGKLLITLEGHQDWVINAQFSPDGEKIVTASADNTAKVWDSKGNLLTTLEGHQDWVRNAQFSQDGTKIVTASADAVRVWKVHTLEELVAWGCEWLEGNLPSEAEEREYEEICKL
ncbi:MAG: WD40 repeat domain-containing protein, partial [Microcystaceae cyanobacterium]